MSRTLAASLVGASHLLLGILFQLESFFALAQPTRDAAGTAATLAWLPFLQLQYVIAAVLLAIIAGVLWRTSLGRVLAIGVVTTANLHLALDQMTFGVLGDHLRPSLGEEQMPSLGLLLDSARAEIDAVAVVNFTLVLATTLALSIGGWRDAVVARVGRTLRPLWRRRATPWLIGSFVALSCAASLCRTVYELEVHPLWALMRARASPALGTSSAEDPYRPRAGTTRESAAAAKEVEAVRAVLAGTKPNIVLIMLESVGAQRLLKDGQPRASAAPMLARLAQQGITFDQIYTTSPFTLQSLLMMHTGGQSITTRQADVPLSPYAGPTMAREFRAAGYRTAFMTGGDLSYAQTIAHIRASGYDTIFHPGSLSEMERQEHALNSWGVDDDFVFERAQEWTRESSAAGQAFFLEILTLATHHPYSVPGGFAGEAAADPLQRYSAALLHTDHLIGGLIESLRAQGVVERTVIAVSGDHGVPFAEVHLGRSGHGRALYEEAVRTFLVLTAPGRLSASSISHRLGTVGDLMPTLVALAGRSPRVLGQDLLAADYRERIAYLNSMRQPARCGLRDGRWKFIGANARVRAELYDLDMDPGEEHDLASGLPDLVATYDELCRAWFEGATALYLSAAGVDAARAAANARAKDDQPGFVATELQGADGPATSR